LAILTPGVRPIRWFRNAPNARIVTGSLNTHWVPRISYRFAVAHVLSMAQADAQVIGSGVAAGVVANPQNESRTE
jgi:hypothetical protein